VGPLEGLQVRVLAVDGHRVVEGVEEGGDGEFDGLEVTDHVPVVEGLAGQDQLDPSGVPVREAAPPRVLGKHVPGLDLEGLADAVEHGANHQRTQGQIAKWRGYSMLGRPSDLALWPVEVWPFPYV